MFNFQAETFDTRNAKAIVTIVQVLQCEVLPPFSTKHNTSANHVANPSLPCIRSDDANVFWLEERLRIFACKTQVFLGKHQNFVLPLLLHQGCLARSAGSHESVRSSTTVALTSDHGCYLAVCSRRETQQ